MKIPTFKQWLLEVGAGGGGPGSGMTPPRQDPTKMPGAWQDYHGPEETDPHDPNAQLPPIQKKKMKKK